MHPLLKRLLIRGPIVFLVAYASAWLLGYLGAGLLSDDKVTINRGNPWSFGLFCFGLLSVAILAFLEWVNYARERRKRPPG